VLVRKDYFFGLCHWLCGTFLYTAHPTKITEPGYCETTSSAVNSGTPSETDSLSPFKYVNYFIFPHPVKIFRNVDFPFHKADTGERFGVLVRADNDKGGPALAMINDSPAAARSTRAESWVFAA
jgi:hypothetical protein